ncbi:hypothetical protein Cdeb_01232 [Caldibacillus debilis GB1]|uniref:Uncharacterized protein n=1 Tax=Caldibacillus debilis GB1 TaxID=1339248 RepID=A0A420VDM8_9BACI|nr:hypothetical protein Cdeb_01232 [Caldibacillus debilis GB1]
MAKRRTIGSLTQSRGTWAINPVTRVKQPKSKHPDRKLAKVLLRKGYWDDV